MQPTNLVDHVQIVGDVEDVCEAAFEGVGGRDEVAEMDRYEDVVEIRPEGPSVVQARRLHVNETVNLVYGCDHIQSSIALLAAPAGDRRQRIRYVNLKSQSLVIIADIE